MGGLIVRCADCHRYADESPAAVASGGWCAPSDTIYNWRQPEPWRCPECKAKYPEPVTYLRPCEDCNSTGKVVASHECEGCDHSCARDEKCELCNGEGSYPTHDCNPGCDHRFGLPLVKVSRGGIKFS
jgi:hypothetical protein